MNLLSLITTTSALIGASADKGIMIGNLQFELWMIIIMAISIALLLVLSAILIAVTIKEKKEAKTNAEDDDTDETADNSDSSLNENVENQAENEEAENAEAENANTEENTVVGEENTEDQPQETTENSESTDTETAADVVENTESQNSESENSESINPNETKREADEQTMEKTVKEETNAKVAVGKLNYYLTESGYYFSLDANNGQQLFVSYSFTTLEGAMKGFETFAKAVLEGNFIVSEDKNGRFRYILNKKYQGPNYKTRVQCENAIASVTKFSQSYKVNVIEPTEEDKAAFAEYLENLKKAKDIDLDAIAAEEANTPKSGAFEIEEGDDGYRFYLYANNRQVLYASNIYASPVSARNGIDAFKKAVYGGVVIIEKDKFSNYRYILRNSTAVTYAGESYDSEASARKSFESVERFVKSATIVPFKKKTEGDDTEE